MNLGAYTQLYLTYNLHKKGLTAHSFYAILSIEKREGNKTMAIKYSVENRTYHAGIERNARLEALERVLGFTKIVIERTTIKNGRYVREGITSSGILIVRPLHEDKIITAFMVRVEKAASVCHGAGKKQIPPKLYEKIIKNAQRHPELFNI